MAKISKAQAGKSLKPGQRLTESGKVVSGKEARRVTALEKGMVSELMKKGPLKDSVAPKKKMKLGGKMKKAQGGMDIPSLPSIAINKFKKMESEKYKKGGTVKAKGGKKMMKRADGSVSPRGLWDNIRAAKGSGKKPTAAMLKQERKIKAKGK